MPNLEKTEGGLVFGKIWKVLLEEEQGIHPMCSRKQNHDQRIRKQASVHREKSASRLGIVKVNSKVTGPQRLLHSLAGGGKHEEGLRQLGTHCSVSWEVVRTENPGAVFKWATAPSPPRPPFWSG